MIKKEVAKILVFVLMVYSIVTYILPLQVQAGNAGLSIENALQWAVNIANDDSHGYSQTKRNGPDYDCSSLVLNALRQAGFNTGASSYTGNMVRGNKSAIDGFEWIPWSSIGSVSNLKRGDILLNIKYHTAFYLGNNKIVEAHGRSQADKNYDNRDVSIANTLPGDQNGQEIWVRSYYWYSSGWNGVLRYKEGTSLTAPALSIGNSSIHIQEGTPVTFNWTSGGTSAIGYNLYVAPLIEGTYQYDWNAAGVRNYVPGNTSTSFTYSAGAFPPGGYCAYIQSMASDGSRVDGNFVWFLITEKPSDVKTAQAQLGVWVSKTKMGESEVKIVPVGKPCYLCYLMIDKETKRNWDDLYSSNYTVKETIYKANGSKIGSYTYTNDNNCYTFTPTEPGEYRGVIEVSGDWEGEQEYTFTAKSFYYGDIDNNGDVTLTDFSMINQALNNQITLTSDQKKRADVNADGRVTQADANLIQQYVLKTITAFPAESHVHSYTSKITKAASCTNRGIRTYTCVCGESYTENIAAKGHTIVTDKAVRADCTNPGKTQGSHCSVCGEIIVSQQPTMATGHQSTVVLDAVPATCQQTGYTGDIWCTDCSQILEYGMKVEKAEHNAVIDEAVAATCTTPGKTEGSHCSVCGTVLEAQRTIAASGHTNTEIRNAVKATCQQTGYTGDTYCTDCGKKLSSGTQITKAGHIIVTDKAVAATCTTAGKTEGSHCSVCGTVIVAQKPVTASGHPNTEIRNAVKATCQQTVIREIPIAQTVGKGYHQEPR